MAAVEVGRNSNFNGYFTNLLLKETIVGDIENDGLPKVVADPRLYWPFLDCLHKGWRPNKERRIMAYQEAVTGACCEGTPTDIHIETAKARKMYKEGTPEALKSALNIYRSVLDIKISKDSVATDTFLRLIAMTNVGILLSVSTHSIQRNTTQQPPKNCLSRCIPVFWMPFPKQPDVSATHSVEAKHIRSEREAVLYFKIGALGYKIPFCKYLYGHALIYSTGGIKKNIPKGMGLLHDAANELHIAEAFFELGSIYERGLMGNIDECIAKDYEIARDFYEASIQASKENQNDVGECVWVPEIGMINRLLRIDNIHLEEDALQNLAGMHYSWIILGHSFLFGTAASLTSTVQPHHFSSLLFLLPILGVALAIYSIVDTISAFKVMTRNQEAVNGMLNAKYAAYTEIVEFLRLSETDLAAKKRLRDLIVRVKNEHGRIQDRFFCNQWLGWYLMVISYFFLIIWILLLLNEVVSISAGCSLWFRSLCELCEFGAPRMDYSCAEDLWSK